MEILESRKERIRKEIEAVQEQRSQQKELKVAPKPKQAKQTVLIDIPALGKKVANLFRGKRLWIHAIILLFIISTATIIALSSNDTEEASVTQHKEKPITQETHKEKVLLPVTVSDQDMVPVPADEIIDESQAPALTEDYMVEPGDTLWTIAEKVYGDGSQWTRIWESNKDMLIQQDSRNIQEAGHWVHTGDIIKIDT